MDGKIDDGEMDGRRSKDGRVEGWEDGQTEGGME